MYGPADHIRISVVVPAFNEEKYLAATLASLQHQDFEQPYEIIVVDNNSTDGTAAVADAFDVTVLHEPHVGVCAARQRGTTAARGHIVVSTDADTVHPPDWLSRIDDAFAASDDVTLVAGPCRYLNATWWAALYPMLLFGMVTQLFRYTGRLVYISATNTAFVRGAFPGYNPTMTQGGDELDVLRHMRNKGRSSWLPDNAVTTSPRRLARGLCYTVLVSLLAHYLFTYVVNRLSSRTMLGTAPAIRTEPAPTTHRRPRWRVILSVALVTLATALVVRATA
jgi:glycosyltransferase involved in cell wall biosynthesis